ncbi:MAG: DUF4421 family protein, partial [Bacteroidia bacterium]
MKFRLKSVWMLLVICCMHYPAQAVSKKVTDSLSVFHHNESSERKSLPAGYDRAAVNTELKGKDSTQKVSDTTYFKAYSDQITGRFYFSRKYTSLIIGDQESDFKLDYRPNTSLNMGVGATYKNLTLNIAYGFPF